MLIKQMFWKHPGLWRKTVQQIAPSIYADVTVDYMFVDNAAMQIIINPKTV
ncbi:MAG: isocitrate/isopropylmalate family dehydrogenase [Chitinophagaceae bacterium]